MAKIEVDELEWAEAQRVMSVANLIGKDSKARAKLQEAVEMVAPDQAGPEIRIRREVNEATSEIRKLVTDFIDETKKEREERLAAEKQRELEGGFIQGRAKLRSEGWTDEGIQQLEEFMEKKGTADHELALPAFEKLHPPPEPLVTGGSNWNFFDHQKDNTSIEALLQGNDEGFLAQAIPAALKDVRGR